MYTGELADELFGSYRYFKNAPSVAAHREESIRRLNEVHMYDGLRCDRVCSAHHIEARYPFFSRELLDFVMSLPPSMLAPHANDNIEKKMLRDAFEHLLPRSIIWRTKEAFSDATSVKSSWKEHLKETALARVAPVDFTQRSILYPYATPNTHEDMYYRNIFTQFYPNAQFASTIPGNWLPLWCGDVVDSSATVLNVRED